MLSTTTFQIQQFMALSVVAKKRQTSVVRIPLTLPRKFIDVSVTYVCCYITADYTLFIYSLQKSERVNIHVVTCSNLTSNFNKLIMNL